MPIEIKYYHVNGSLAETHVYESSVAAFTDMCSKRMEALAHPVGTTSGCYAYRPWQDGHTQEVFDAKLAMCCNDPAEYSQRLIDADICSRPSLYSRG